MQNSSLSLFSFTLGLIVAIVWGINFLMVKLAVEQIQPLTLCALRFFLVAVPAVFFISKPKVSWKIIIAYGTLNFMIQFALAFIGMSMGVSPGIASLIFQFGVFFSLFFAWLFMNQRVSLLQIMGAIISFSGIIIIAAHRGGDYQLWGIIMLILSTVSVGLGNVVSVKLKSVNMFSIVTWGSLISFPPLAILAFIFEDPLPLLSDLSQLSSTTIIAYLYITFMSTHVGYGLWSWLMARYPVATIAPFTMLCPIITLFASAMFMGELLEPYKIIAAIVVMSGLCINRFGDVIWERMSFSSVNKQDNMI